MNKYAEKLKDPRWQRKRLEIFQRDNWRCRLCGDEGETLHVHHLAYLKDKEPWEIHNGLLITLCSECHAQTKEEDEDMSALESFMTDVGVLLDTYWRTGLGAWEIITLAEALSHIKKPNTEGVIGIEIKCNTWKPKGFKV